MTTHGNLNCVPGQVVKLTRNYYKENWEAVEDPLARVFQNANLSDATSVQRALWEVRRAYGVQGISHEEIHVMSKWFSENIGKALLQWTPGADSNAKAADELASATGRRYELSLAMKFLHFCRPDCVPPFDRFAFVSLALTSEGLSNDLNWESHPRGHQEVSRWLKAFKEFHDFRLEGLSKLRKEILAGIKPKDNALAEKSITTVTICDKVLWLWGRGE